METILGHRHVMIYRRTHNVTLIFHNMSVSCLWVTYAFVMLLLAMISLHMLTFRLMVAMVAEFCSLVILIHNTERMISST